MRRGLIALPFAIAAILNALLLLGSPVWIRSHRIERDGFLFGAPWAWLIDPLPFGDFHNNLANQVLGYVAILWIPALLYSLCLCLLLRALHVMSSLRSQSSLR